MRHIFLYFDQNITSTIAAGTKLNVVVVAADSPNDADILVAKKAVDVNYGFGAAWATSVGGSAVPADGFYSRSGPTGGVYTYNYVSSVGPPIVTSASPFVMIPWLSPVNLAPDKLRGMPSVVGSYSTGTVTSSGANNQTITLANGTFPTWVGVGSYLEVNISGVTTVYAVASRSSGSVIVLAGTGPAGTGGSIPFVVYGGTAGLDGAPSMARQILFDAHVVIGT